ncbi:MAG: hypothetical protein IPJ41_18485 [Phycisphaerales bacterium]|nr:hypothetical protein [Phycisphaerales bacterium]
MVIDPKLYTKVTGRTGNPHERLGMAQVELTKAKARREDQREKIMLRKAGFIRRGGMIGFVVRLLFTNPKLGLVVLAVIGVLVVGSMQHWW